MLKRLLDQTLAIVEERQRVKKAIALWSNGLPVGSPWYVKNDWPIPLWTQLLKDRKIRIKDVDFSGEIDDGSLQQKTELFGYIHHNEFWEVLSKRVASEDPRWKIWLQVAFEDGNTEFLNNYPGIITRDELLHASWHPHCKQWVLEQPIYKTQEQWETLWNPMSYEFHFRHHMTYKSKTDNFADLVKANIPFEGTQTASKAFWDIMSVLECEKGNSTYYREGLKEIWELSRNPVPYEVVASAYGWVPQASTVSADLYSDCITIAHYGLSNRLWTGSTQHPTHAEKTSLGIYLDIIQPGSRKELIELLAGHYSLERSRVEEVSWNASFGEVRV